MRHLLEVCQPSSTGPTRRISGYAPITSLRILFGTPFIPSAVFALSLQPALFSSSRVKSSLRRTTQELRPCLCIRSTCGNKLRTMYLTWSALSRPMVFLLVTNLLVTILKARPHGSFSTSPIKSFKHSSRLFFMPCLGADFAFNHASRSRGSPFYRVNLRRAVRHFRRRTDNWSFHQYIESPVCPRPRRVMEWSDAATIFRLAARTVSSNVPADLAQPSSSMSLVSSRCSQNLTFLSRVGSRRGSLQSRPFPHSLGASVPPTSLSEAFLKEEDLGLEDLESIVGRKVAALHTYPATYTQTNAPSVSRKSPMLNSGLQTWIPAILDAFWYQAELSDHLCCSPMSNTSASLSLAVCIRRFWASFPLPRLSCRNFTFHPSTTVALSVNIGQESLPEAWVSSSSPLSA